MSQVHGSKTNTVFNSRIPDPLTPFFLCAFATLREIILSARDHLDLDLGVQRQTGHGHGRTGRIITLDYTGIDPVHGVKTIDLNGVSRTCAYDPNGNMITSPDFTNATNPLNRAITYDADNMPTRIVHANGATVDFVYDGVSKRTKKLVASGKTVLYLGDHFEVENGVNIKYIFGGNLRLAQIKGSLTSSSISYFHKDHLGSTAAVTNEAGLKIESTTYEPFGSTRTQESTVVSAYKFTDQEADVETNLYNYDARLYDPVLGMFVTPDSIVPKIYDPQDLNRFAYCENNPLIYTDPTGHGTGPAWQGGPEENINDKRHIIDRYTKPKESEFWWGEKENRRKVFDYFYNGPIGQKGRFWGYLAAGAVDVGPALVKNPKATWSGIKGLFSGIKGLFGGLFGKGGTSKITAEGITKIENYLKSINSLDEPLNKAALDRIKSGQATIKDMPFYEHELLEAKLVEKGLAKGQALDVAQEAAHKAALDQLGHHPFDIYSPEVVIQADKMSYGQNMNPSYYERWGL